ncbi:hypothetical protein KEM54_004522, partial [Ascosphaera aggregata]
QQQQHRKLTEEERDQIDTETADLIRELSASISNLASAENLRHETQEAIILKKFPLVNSKLWKWASGSSSTDSRAFRSEEQERLQGIEKTIKTVRENVLWTLRSRLQSAAETQRIMAEKRVERIKEKEKSILYKMDKHGAIPTSSTSTAAGTARSTRGVPASEPSSFSVPSMRGQNMLQEQEVTEIESQLSQEQLQLFAEENDAML